MAMAARRSNCGTSIYWGAVDASNRGEADYVRMVPSRDMLSAGGGGDEEARAAMTLVEMLSEAGEMPNSLLMVLDDVDRLCVSPVQGQEDTAASCWQ